jgi:hypothetical protein
VAWAFRTSLRERSILPLLRVRFGYRRVHVMLRREAWAINQKETYRLYKELGPQLRN